MEMERVVAFGESGDDNFWEIPAIFLLDEDP